jgi:FMN phosphatase YigB (HAD superfamily)
MESTSAPVAFLFDVDNTLLDNDRVKAELAAGIEEAVGPEAGARFWEIYEDVRRMRDYVDYPHTLQRFREVFRREPAFPVGARPDQRFGDFSSPDPESGPDSENHQS